MGGLLHLFNFNKGGMAKKIRTDKKHDGGKYSILLKLRKVHNVCKENALLFTL